MIYIGLEVVFIYPSRWRRVNYDYALGLDLGWSIQSQQLAPSLDALEHAIEETWITAAILGVDGLLCLLRLCLDFSDQP